MKLNLSTYVQSSLELHSLVEWKLLIIYKQRRDWPSKLHDLDEAANTSSLEFCTLKFVMSSEGDPPLSLRPFPVADQKPKNLAEFIARVNAQPGGFRSITEDKLREELRNSEDPDAADDQDEVSEAAGEADVAEKDPGVARMEVLKNIEYGCSYMV